MALFTTTTVVIAGIAFVIVLYFLIRFLQKKGILHEVPSNTSSGWV